MKDMAEVCEAFMTDSVENAKEWKHFALKGAHLPWAPQMERPADPPTRHEFQEKLKQAEQLVLEPKGR